MSLKINNLKFTNRLFTVMPEIFSVTAPTPLKNVKVTHLNQDVLDLLEIDIQSTKTPSFTRFLNADLDFDGLFFGASVYAGHQFGHRVPRLGDGRAITLCEIKNSKNSFFELQLKGAGLTKYSRMGDGKAVFRSSLREYLASAHLNALGVPTTLALSLTKGEDVVYRETMEPSAMVMRVAESFLRFGHFEYYFFENEMDELKKLVDFTIENYYGQHKDHENKYVLFFQEVVKKTAKLFAHWQAIGFCHGVLNTDNTSILGLTIDYGPFGFIDNYDQDFICNHSDHEGRYSLGNQPGIGMWNLDRLALCLSPFIEKEALERTLETYPPIFLYEYRRHLLEKCGLFKVQFEDENFLKLLLNMLVATKFDYTVFFRALARYEKGSRKLEGLDHELLSNWLGEYDQRLEVEELDQCARHEKMLKINPKFILRNYIAQMCLEDESLIDTVFEILSAPFDEWESYSDWAGPAPVKYKNLSVSCSS